MATASELRPRFANLTSLETDIPDISSILTVEGNLTPEMLEIKKSQLKSKLQSGEITKPQYLNYINQLDAKPLYDSNSFIPRNLNNVLQNPRNITDDIIRNIISIKPRLISRADIVNTGSLINIVGINTLEIKLDIYDKPFSPRLINWVEPIDVSGFNKTLFYTEVDSQLKVGDRVFIVNGNYDSDLLIQVDKYKKGRDGYKVLEIDECKVVLDIDYTGVLPYIDDEIDKFIKVHYVRDRAEFLQVNRQITTRGGALNYRFSFYQNNIVFVDNSYTPHLSGWGNNSGISSPGFYVRDDSANPPTWTDITTSFLSGSFSFAQATYSNNNRVKIMNGSFEYNGRSYQEGFAYKWTVGPTQSYWDVDPKYSKPFLTKTNFRDGNFKGTWNTGLFGRQDKRIFWDGDGSIWQIGTLLNTYWVKGTLNSKYTSEESFFAAIDEYGLPYQKANLPDNNGRGYNYIIDSFIESSTITNGNIIRTQFGSQSATYSVVENHLISATTSYSNIIKAGLFEECFFNNTSINGAEISNSRSFNSKFGAIKSINSKFRESVLKDSSYISDKIIKIQSYDEWSGSEFGPYSGVSNKFYKFYITKDKYDRLKNKDFFYIKGLKINNNSREVINFFDKKFTLSSFTDYNDEFNNISNTFYKRPVEYVAYLSSPLENEYKITTVTDGTNYFSSTVGINENASYSVDIVIKTSDALGYVINGIDFNRDQSVSTTSSVTMSSYLGNILDVSDAYIIDSDFDSGLMETSNWIYGDNINLNNDLNFSIPTVEGGKYNMSIGSTANSILNVSLTYNYNLPESDDDSLNVGNVVFLNSVWYEVKNYVTGLVLGTPGSGYFTASGLTVSGTSSGQGLTLEILANGTVSNVSIINNGINYEVGDVLTIQSGNSDATVVVTSVTSSLDCLPTDYIITASDGLGNLQIREIYQPGTSSIFWSLKLGGSFSTPGAQNRYGYLHKSKLHRTKIKSGIFRRSNFSGSLIENDDYNSSDKDYQDLERIRNLVISDSLFERNSNILSNATYINSHFLSGSNTWVNGIIQKSIWNGPTFSNGIIKESRWVNGLLNSGMFYESRTFNANPSTASKFFYNENILSYYKDGITSATLSNDRYSWQNGTFRLGMRNKTSEFYKSDWEGGTFQSGKFYYSKWYDGTLVNGIFGDVSLDTMDTTFYNGTVSYCIVEKAHFYASDTSLEESTQNNIRWYNGIFNDGLFSTNWQQYTASNTGTWFNGEFNGGEFASLAKWKNGIFNNGKFTTGYGWTLSNSTSILDYGWENGTFNGGEFGVASLGTNSTWFNGQFDGGIFKGRVWNFGIFTKGDFNGSSTYSAVGGGFGSPNAKNFVDSFRSEFYGLWRDGYYTDQKDKLIKDTKLWTTVERAEVASLRKPFVAYNMNNSLWLNGTFSHQSGEMNNVVWMNGTFDKGKFLSSAFNPYVRRNPDPKNVWQYEYIPELLFNGNFTSSIGGWVTASGFNGISAYSTFSIVSDQAYFISDFDAPSLYFTSSTYLTSGTYQINFDLVTYSSPYNNLYLSVRTGNNITKLISQINDTHLGSQTITKTLNEGTFSIYVDTDGQGGSLTLDNMSIKLSPTASFNFSDTCIWTDGYFDNGDFYISKWEKGNFVIGTGWGMIWKNGISNYMNAINIFWEDGLWRNGNWYGSGFEFDGEVDDDFTKQILFRGMSWSGTSSLHIWNIFESTLESNIQYYSTASTPYLDSSIDPIIPSPPIIIIPSL